MNSKVGRISRRGLLAGAAGSAAILGSGIEPAAAVPRHRVGPRPDGVPSGLISISSPPEVGVSYRFAGWADLTPLDSFASGRNFEDEGVSSVSGGLLGCFFEIPPGAVVHDVEAYYLATTGTELKVAVWSSGIANLSNVIASTPLGPNPAVEMHVTRLPIPASTNGPYPHGCMLAVYANATNDQGVQLNGFRVGFRYGPLTTVLLPEPVTAYTSTSALKAGETHVISLASHVPLGTNGAQYVVELSSPSGSGSLVAGPAGKTPSVPAAAWHTHAPHVTAPITTPVSSSREIAVHSAHGSGHTHYRVRLLGYLV